MTTIGRQLWICRTHRDNSGRRCMSCMAAMTFNLSRRFCHCGVAATGYRMMSADALVEYFCDDHFQDMPPTDAAKEGSANVR